MHMLYPWDWDEAIDYSLFNDLALELTDDGDIRTRLNLRQQNIIKLDYICLLTNMINQEKQKCCLKKI